MDVHLLPDKAPPDPGVICPDGGVLCGMRHHRFQLAEGGVQGDEAVACRPELGDHLWEGRGVEC